MNDFDFDVITGPSLADHKARPEEQADDAPGAHETHPFPLPGVQPAAALGSGTPPRP